MDKSQIVTKIIGSPKNPVKEKGRAFAPTNIALCKYWGKRNEKINLPLNPSLSISMGDLGTKTVVSMSDKEDQVFLNGEYLDPSNSFTTRLQTYLDLYRPSPNTFFQVHTENNIPTAAGLASSASGFAALVLALNDLFGWNLEQRNLSILARIGSGSASRSIYEGFVTWHAGEREDGMDSYAEPLEVRWPEFRVGTLTLSTEQKKVGSRSGMRLTKETSSLYQGWPDKARFDFNLLQEAITHKDFSQLGRVSEGNALTMHATMIGAWPPLLYWLPESVAHMHKIWELRESGVPVYFTMDAGPNLKLLFLAETQSILEENFPKMKVVVPF